MQFDVRLGSPGDQASYGIERHLASAMQSELVQLVEREVHQAGE